MARSASTSIRGAAVGDLAVAHQQVVEIAKALSRDVKIIVFDEPTAVLSTARCRAAARASSPSCAIQGVGIVYISHRLEEVFRIADRMTVMKDGALVGVTTPQRVGIDDVIRMMVGRPLAALFPKARASADRRRGAACGEPAARRAGCAASASPSSAGEIVGLGGLVGSGRTEMARLIFGADAREAGEILLHGKPVKIALARCDAVLAGIGLVPEDRKHQGVVLDMSIRINTTMARLQPVVNALGFIRRQAERATVDSARRAPAPEDRPAWRRRSPACRAATSRRSCWRSGSMPTATSSSWTSRRAASMSAPRPRSTA